MQKFLYSRKEAAAMLSISVTALHYLIVRGDIKVRRLGGRVLVHHKELERLAAHDIIEHLVPKKSSPRQGGTPAENKRE